MHLDKCAAESISKYEQFPWKAVAEIVSIPTTEPKKRLLPGPKIKNKEDNMVKEAAIARLYLQERGSMIKTLYGDKNHDPLTKEKIQAIYAAVKRKMGHGVSKEDMLEGIVKADGKITRDQPEMNRLMREHLE